MRSGGKEIRRYFKKEQSLELLDLLISWDALLR
jgi:hypothetical protein